MTGRDRIVVIVVAMAAALGGFWFLVLGPKRAEAGAVSTKIAAAQKRLDAANASAAQAEQAKHDYDSDYAAVARLGKAVPVDDNVPSLVYQLQSVSHSAKVDFRSLQLSPGASSAPSAAAAPAATPPAKGSSSPSSSATPAPATQLAASALPPGASVGPAGFPTMPFTFVFDGSYFDMGRMLHDIDSFISVKGKAVDVHGRLLTVDGFALQAGPKGFPQVKATLSSTAYLLPSDQGATAGATASGPAGATTNTAPAGTASAAPPAAAATGMTP